MVNATRTASLRRVNVKENVVTIAVPRQVKQTSVARIRKSKVFLKDTKNGSESYRFFVLLIQNKLVHLIELSFHVL